MRPTIPLFLLLLTTLTSVAQESSFKILSISSDSCSMSLIVPEPHYLHLSIQDAYLLLENEKETLLELRDCKLNEQLVEGKYFEWSAYHHPGNLYRVNWLRSSDIIQSMEIHNDECTLRLTLMVLE